MASTSGTDYLVTGGTGFLGRFLVERLLAHREGTIHVVVRLSSMERFERLQQRWGPRVQPVAGDLGQPGLGIDPHWLTQHSSRIGHMFHLAAIYDLTADEARNRELNVTGTEYAVQVANQLPSATFHHVSSIAVAGDHRGRFTEEDLDLGQGFPTPYHRTKFLAEKAARDQLTVPWRVYRPAVVVGDSHTGEMHKVDGPYYLFGTLRAAGALPAWLPLVAPELGRTNIVPVDYVVEAMDHIAHQPHLDQTVFHLAHPNGQRASTVYNALARAVHGPRIALPVRTPTVQRVSERALAGATSMPVLGTLNEAVLRRLGIPAEILSQLTLPSRFDTTHTQRALLGTDVEVPRFAEYAAKLYDYWERNLDPRLGADQRLRRLMAGRVVVVTGASSGIGHATAVTLARYGATVCMVARSEDALTGVAREIEEFGGTAYCYPADLSVTAEIDKLTERLLAEHPRIHVLINNAGRSIRRSITASLDRFHDVERTTALNYFGAVKLTMGLLQQMIDGDGGHVVNISTAGTQLHTPRFSAYIGSKAALEAWSTVAAAELFGHGIRFSTVNMPLVRTPMIAPTKIYDNFPSLTPMQATGLITKALRTRAHKVTTLQGDAAQLAQPVINGRLLNLAYSLFSDSAAARGRTPSEEETHPNAAQSVLSRLAKGIHW